jgi:hypothetical protein
MPNLTNDKRVLIQNMSQVIKHAEDVLRTLNKQSEEYDMMEAVIENFEGQKKSLEAAFKVIGQ